VADRLLEALRTAGADGLDGTAQRDLFARHASGARLDAARKLLEDRGLAYTEEEPTGGRPRTVTYATKALQARKGPDQGLPSPTSLPSQRQTGGGA
jgi:sugar phosphate isomerase/epimerase